MAVQRNDGTGLENLVALLERAFLPIGFTVEQRKPVFNESKVQIAELDILVKGNVGSVEYKMLVECRDRPSEGAAPAAWIEQLVGRRNRLKVDTIVAVSTTGFAPGAVEFAAEANIRLREFTRLEFTDVVSWLPMFSPLWTRTANMLGVKTLGQKKT